MLSLHKQLRVESASRKDGAGATHRGHGRADRRGARLYGLTEEEIRIVEASSK
ncbi:MAG: hypothetical protein M0Q13_13725 [Methanothrix sp.]|nr:hypothetical protein [Methanothrix sp.]